jgi:hypothetical protein
MLHLKYECKVNTVKLPLISIDLCLKPVFENANAGRNTGCLSVVNCAALEPRLSVVSWASQLAKVMLAMQTVSRKRGSHDGVYGNEKCP